MPVAIIWCSLLIHRCFLCVPLALAGVQIHGGLGGAEVLLALLGQLDGVLDQADHCEQQADGNDDVHQLLGDLQHRGLAGAQKLDDVEHDDADIHVEEGEDHVGDDEHDLLHLEGHHVQKEIDAQVLAVGNSRRDRQIDHPDEHDGGKLLHPCPRMMQNKPTEHLKCEHYCQYDEAKRRQIQLDVIQECF